jgi:hypothetical protein
VIEANFLWQEDPAWTNQQRLDDLNLRAGQAVSNAVAEFQASLKNFGMTVA